MTKEILVALTVINTVVIIAYLFLFVRTLFDVHPFYKITSIQSIFFIWKKNLFLPTHSLLTVHFDNIYIIREIIDEVLAKIVPPQPEKVFVHISKTVTLPREEEEIETFVGLNKGVRQPDRVSGMYI